LKVKSFSGILCFVETRNASNHAAKELLLAEMVYKAAVEKHRREQTELSRHVVAEAYRQYMATQRDVMVSSWNLGCEQLVSCPKCGAPTLARRWACTPPAKEERRRRPRRSVPKWAAPFVEQGAERVTRYSCSACSFGVAVVT
jgi:hypothetical protein